MEQVEAHVAVRDALMRICTILMWTFSDLRKKTVTEKGCPATTQGVIPTEYGAIISTESGIKFATIYMISENGGSLPESEIARVITGVAKSINAGAVYVVCEAVRHSPDSDTPEHVVLTHLKGFGMSFMAYAPIQEDGGIGQIEFLLDGVKGRGEGLTPTWFDMIDIDGESSQLDETNLNQSEFN